MNGEVVILGVDPGLRITGFGAVVCTPARTQALDYGHIKTDSRAAIEARLHAIYWGIRDAIRRFDAQELAIELPFVAINIRSAFAIGEARAAAMLAAAEERVTVFQYTPAEVKQCVSGYGRSDQTSDSGERALAAWAAVAPHARGRRRRACDRDLSLREPAHARPGTYPLTPGHGL